MSTSNRQRFYLLMTRFMVGFWGIFSIYGGIYGDKRGCFIVNNQS
ncbi:MAG TPA: hypothetical protein V6D15_08380 [Oculatellaceae cyanobacterium]